MSEYTIKKFIANLTKEELLSRVILKLDNDRLHSKYKDALKVISRPFLDLVMMPVITFKDGSNFGTMYINHNLLHKYDISVDEIFTVAKQNTDKQDWRRFTMGDLFGELFNSSSLNMHIFTNAEKFNGAIVITQNNMFEELAEILEQDLWILPSSVHEVIAIQVNFYTYENVKNMVKDINENEVEEEEVLSYSIYRYSRETGTITIAQVD